MDIKMQQEQLTDDLISELMPLLSQHKDELCMYEDFELNPQWDAYYGLQKLNVLRVYTLRENGYLIGYAAFAVHQNMHYQDRTHAVQDVLYLDPQCRGKLLGLQFIKYTEAMLTQEGVHVVSHHIKTKFDWGKMIERIGYSPVEKIYEKRLN